MANLLFYLMAVGAVASAVGVVIARSPIASVLSLLGSFFCLATIYLLAGFQFIAAAQLLVYAGAIMVLFLFVIMLLNLGGPEREGLLEATVLRSRKLPLVLAICTAVLVISLLAVAGQREAFVTDPRLARDGIDSIPALAALLFGPYLLAFEAAGILLLAATLAVLVLAKRQRTTGAAPQHRAVVEPAPAPPPPPRRPPARELEQEVGAAR